MSAARRTSSLLAGLALALAGAGVAVTAPASAAQEGAASRWIVVLEEGADPGSVSRAHGRAHGAEVDHVYAHALRGYSARLSERAVRDVRADSRVRSVEPDVEVKVEPQGKPAPPPPSNPPAQVVPTGVARVGSTALPSFAGVTVAVVDTGISRHSDLVLGPGVNCSSGSSTADGHGHGTHVAGTIGAVDNAIGVVGVAPGVTLLPVRVLDNKGSGLTSNVVCGLDWITAQGGAVDVANLSLGYPGSSAGPDDAACTAGVAMQQAVCRTKRAGTTVVVAAGNQSTDTDTRMPSSFPGAIAVSALADSDGVFAPGATWSGTCRTEVEDRIAGFSNYGEGVELIAPGVCILSTDRSGGYSTKSGTSMSSPHVAGAAAIARARDSGLSPDAVLATLLAAASADWDATGDRDAEKEPLLRLAGL